MIDGFYNVIKPTGYTSSDVVVRLRGILSSTLGFRVKTGHLGTLDPGGVGVLPIAVGNATKLFDSLRSEKKVYVAQAVFGCTTDTLDAYGTIISATPAKRITKQEVELAFQSFIGEYNQVPPLYSAKSVEGKRAYEMARKGKDFQLPSQKISIYNIVLLTFENNAVTFEITCSGGTYIRSFVRDLGEKLGVDAYMSFIIRTYADGFSIQDAVTLEDIEKDYTRGFTTLEDYASQFPIIQLNEAEQKAFGVGLPVPAVGDGLFKVCANGRFIGVCSTNFGNLKKVAMKDDSVLDIEDANALLFPQKIALALGYFDALHLGHKALIEACKKKNAIPALFTLKGNLSQIITGKASLDLYSFEERTASYLSCGIQKVLYATVTKDFIQTSPQDFLDILVSKLNVGYFICGEDYTFGYKGEGTVSDLIAFAQAKGITVEVVPIRKTEGEKISSSRIKEAVQKGNIPLANEMLGYPYYIKGKVIKGRGDGKGLGYPTINICLDASRVAPKYGVYETRVKIKGNTYPCVTNVGAHPTFLDMQINVETFIIGYMGDLYGKTVKVEFIRYLRPVISFADKEELKEQITKDIEEVQDGRN